MSKHPLIAPCLLGLLSACSSSPAAAPAPEMTSTAMDNADGVALYWGGLDRLLVHEKDQSLRAAMHLLEERLLELPAELGREDVPEDAMALALRALRGPLQFRMGFRETPGQALPVYGQLALPEENAELAQALASRFAKLIEGYVQQGAGRDEHGLASIPLGPASAHHGSLGSSFVLGIGEVVDEPLGLGTLGLPAGVEMAVGFKMDFDQYFQGLETAMAMAGEEAMEGMQFMDMFPMEGVILTAALGADAERSYTVTTMRNYEELLESTTGRPAGWLTREAMEMVPQDAVWASLGTANWAGTIDMVVDMIETMAQAQGEDPFGGQDPLDMVAALTGIHLQRDLFEHLGHEWGLYMSESSGGGGLASLVFFTRLEDPAGLEPTLARIEGMVNELVGAGTKGHVAFRHWERGGQEYRSLTFPGLPLPFELTYALVDDFLVKGFAPQAVIAQVEHARRGGRSLLDNPRFRELTGAGDLEELFALSFVDAPMLLADGYGWSQMVCSALANGTRSPREPERDAGLILPVYSDLARDAKATVTLTRLVDGDLVAMAQGDASALVNMTALLGLVDRMPALLVLPALAGAGVARVAQQQAMAEATLQRVPAESERARLLQGLGYVGDGQDADQDDD